MAGDGPSGARHPAGVTPPAGAGAGGRPLGHPSELPVLRGLTPGQRAAVTASASPLSVVAGAGSGKTRVLTRRVAYRALTGDIDPEHAVVVTFTRKAAGELRRRLWQLEVDGVTVGTFHGLAYAELRRHWADAGRQPPAVVPDPVPVLRRLTRDPGTVVGGPDGTGGSGRRPGRGATGRAAGDGPAGPGDLLRALAAEIDWAQARDVSPDGYGAAARSADRRPARPVDEIADLYRAYLEEKRRRHVVDLHDLVRGAARLVEEDAATAAALRWRYRHFFVDEFQDVNPAQWRLLQALLGGRPDLFVVGDAQQAIYSWNGADPTFMARLPELIPGTGVLRLDENHRCTPQVVAVAATALPPSGGDGSGPPPTSRPDGPLPEVRPFDDDEAEAAAVARWLRQVRPPGGRWSNMAVLARTHARLAPVAAALRRAGIPVRSADAGTDTAADDGVSTEGAQRPDGGGREVTSDAPGERSGAAREARPTDAPPGDGPASDGPEAGNQPDGVELATFHRAKGLEWDAVAVVGLEDGMVPIAYARSTEALAEERRLLYVALSRAGRHLWCSWAEQRQVGDRRRPTKPSPWVPALCLAASPPPVASPAVALRHLSALRRQLVDPADTDGHVNPGPVAVADDRGPPVSGDRADGPTAGSA